MSIKLHFKVEFLKIQKNDKFNLTFEEQFKNYIKINDIEKVIQKIQNYDEPFTFNLEIEILSNVIKTFEIKLNYGNKTKVIKFSLKSPLYNEEQFPTYEYNQSFKKINYEKNIDTKNNEKLKISPFGVCPGGFTEKKISSIPKKYLIIEVNGKEYKNSEINFPEFKTEFPRWYGNISIKFPIFYVINDCYIPTINDFNDYEIFKNNNSTKENYLAELKRYSPSYKSFLTFAYCYYNSNSFLQCFNDVFIEYFPNENNFKKLLKKMNKLIIYITFLKVLLRKYKIMI